jgi:polyisoprenoid-binding protein YceI
MTDTTEGPEALLRGSGAGHWVLDPQQSSVKIGNKTLWGLSTVRGSFSEVSGEGDVAADGSVTGKLVIGAASVNTRNSKRDTHLRSGDFFKADEHPTIVFTAREAKLDSSGRLAVTGDLEAGGTSRPLSFTATITDATPEAATLSAEAEVDRLSYGMTWNQLGMVGPRTQVSVVARFTKQGAAA